MLAGSTLILRCDLMTNLSEDIDSVRSEGLVNRVVSVPDRRRARRADRNRRVHLCMPVDRTVLAPLLRHDPININYDGGGDVYVPEIEAILPRLSWCRDEEDVCRVVHEELCKTFGLAAVGARTACAQMAREIWRLVDDYRSTTDSLPGARASSCSWVSRFQLRAVRGGRE